MTEEIRKNKAIDKAKNYDEVFRSATGELVLYDLVTEVGFLSKNFSPDPYENAYLSGQRDLISYIMKNLSYDIAALNKLLEKGKQYEDKYSPLDQ